MSYLSKRFCQSKKSKYMILASTKDDIAGDMESRNRKLLTYEKDDEYTLVLIWSSQLLIFSLDLVL